MNLAFCAYVHLNQHFPLIMIMIKSSTSKKTNKSTTLDLHKRRRLINIVSPPPADSRIDTSPLYTAGPLPQDPDFVADRE